MNLKAILVNLLIGLILIPIGRLVLKLSFLDIVLFYLLIIIILFPILKGNLNFYRRIKENLILILYIFILLAAILIISYRFLEYKGYKLDLGKTKGQTEKLKPLPKEEIISECSDDESTFCSTFSDIEQEFDESELPYFTTDPENPKILEANIPISKTKDNSNLWIKEKSFTPEFHFEIQIKFYNEEKGNLTISYGDDWRCIIGENNFNTLTCESQYSNKTEKARFSQHLSSKNHLNIKPKEEVIISGSTTLVEDNKLKISLLLNYFDIESQDVEESFEFEIKYLSANPKEDKRRFGVGIIDPLDEGIRIEFMKLEVKGGT